MPNATSHPEIEVKLRVPDLRALRAALARLGARRVSLRTHEFNTIYDTPSQDLRRRGQLIRIRTERSAGRTRRDFQQDSEAILTFKAPVIRPGQPAKRAGKSAYRSRYKVKEEVEVSLRGVRQMDRILRELRLRPVFRYEKYRTTYRFPGIRGLKIELDETPIGYFFELEGPAEGIDRAASRLGYARSEYITDTYGSLYLADCRRHGRAPADMLFSHTKKLR